MTAKPPADDTPGDDHEEDMLDRAETAPGPDGAPGKA